MANHDNCYVEEKSICPDCGKEIIRTNIEIDSDTSNLIEGITIELICAQQGLDSFLKKDLLLANSDQEAYGIVRAFLDTIAFRNAALQKVINHEKDLGHIDFKIGYRLFPFGGYWAYHEI